MISGAYPVPPPRSTWRWRVARSTISLSPSLIPATTMMPTVPLAQLTSVLGLSIALLFALFYLHCFLWGGRGQAFGYLSSALPPSPIGFPPLAQRFIDPGPAGSLGRDPLNAGKTVANRSSAAGRGRTSHSSSSRNSARMLTANRMSVRASGGGGAGGGGAGGGGTAGGGGQRLLMRKIYSQMPIDARAKHRSSMVSMAGTDDKYRRGKKRQLPLPPGAGGGGDGPSGAATTTSTGVTARNFAPLPDGVRFV